ncbi:hypothetical protein V6N11_008533 [Hibiscus sabdariffa]|uniref:Uncharacterized protein n=1 Tax=Hibiscus sabdariffa TaxID=183260 RepID=A0ABR2PNN2_9ROSI
MTWKNYNVGGQQVKKKKKTLGLLGILRTSGSCFGQALQPQIWLKVLHSFLIIRPQSFSKQFSFSPGNPAELLPCYHLRRWDE